VAETAGLRLVHDVLDAQLLDRRRRKIGRADALVLELRDGAPPRVAAILIGGAVREERVGRWAVAVAGWFRALVGVRAGGVSRVPFAALREVAGCVELDVDGDTLESGRSERWLDANIVCRIPGSHGEQK
jgi:hypothetical protein